MRTLVFDTETTGLHEPYIVQLAAVLFDGRKPISQMSVIVEPVANDGSIVSIPDEVAAIHGVTNEIAANLGVQRWFALSLFANMLLRADRLVAHNNAFDTRVIKCEIAREPLHALTTLIDTTPAICTMLVSTPICKIPKKSGFGNKWPTLKEAHEFFLKESFDGAHDALNDVNACARVLWALEDGGHIK